MKGVDAIVKDATAQSVGISNATSSDSSSSSSSSLISVDEDGEGDASSSHPALTIHGVPSEFAFQSPGIPEPLLEKGLGKPRLINVGLPASVGPKQWRRIMTAEVLPRLAAFKPNLLLISAGFDAHTKDTINMGYLGLREDDYGWITEQLVKISNLPECDGRLVSVLEGGYKIQGRVVSAFARSVAAHVRALSTRTKEVWNTAKERVRAIHPL